MEISDASETRQTIYMTDQRKEALSRAALLAAMSLHTSHARPDTLPSDARSTLAQSYAHMTTLTEKDVRALEPLYLGTVQCPDKGCVAMRSLHDRCSRDYVVASIKELDDSIPDTDLDHQSLRYMGKFGLKFAAKSDLRQDWRLQQASETVHDPGRLEETMSDARLNAFRPSEYGELSGPNHAPETTLESVDVRTLLEYNVVDQPERYTEDIYKSVKE